MGTLRTLFALSVVFAHSYGFVLVGGRNAVQLFYITSGFLISYVLVEKRSYSTTKAFYINRFLRLYPVYAVVTVLTLTGYFIHDERLFFDVYRDAPDAARVLLVVANALLFLQDWIMFIGVDGGELVVVEYFKDSDVVLYRGLVVSQAWTLGLELTFYLIAPFVLPSRRSIGVLLVLSIGVRVVLIVIGVGAKDPWTYRFFPAELAFFLLGALVHQILRPLYANLSTERLKTASSYATYFLIAFTLLYWLLPVSEVAKTVVLFSSFLVLLPLAFVFQAATPWDKQLGELSYPIYIGHMAVVLITTHVVESVGGVSKVAFTFFCVLFTILFAIVLHRFVARPFERVRDRFRLRE